MVAVEADCPGAYGVNRYVRGESADSNLEEALAGFKRFPAWMWRSADVLDFNRLAPRVRRFTAPGSRKTGFSG